MALETRTVTGAKPGGFNVPTNSLDLHVLYREIQAAIADGGNALTDRTLNWIRREDGDVNMDFDQALDAAEELAIDAIVNAHPSIVRRQGEQRQVFEAAFPPTTGDDADDLFAVGDLWVDTNSDKTYAVTDVTVGAAVWRLLAPEAGSVTVAAVDPTNLDDTPDGGYSVGDLWVNSVTGNVFILVDGTNNAAVWRPVTPHVMGGYIVDGASLTTTTHNDTAYVEKLSVVTPSVEAGDYVIWYSYNWNIDSTSQDFDARIQVDNTTTVHHHVEEATDASGDYDNTGSGQQMPASGWAKVTLTAGVHTIDLDFVAPAANVPVSMWNARILVQRVSGDPVS